MDVRHCTGLLVCHLEKVRFAALKIQLHRVDNQWLQAWYQWRDKQLKAAMDELVKSIL